MVWAGNFPLAKLGLHELGPVTMSATRAVIAAPLLVLISRVLEGPLPPLARRDLTAVIVLAVTWPRRWWWRSPPRAGRGSGCPRSTWPGSASPWPRCC